MELMVCRLCLCVGVGGGLKQQKVIVRSNRSPSLFERGETFERSPQKWLPQNTTESPQKQPAIVRRTSNRLREEG